MPIVVIRSLTITVGLFVVGLMTPLQTAASVLALKDVSGAIDAEITTDPPNPVATDPNNGILLAWDEMQGVTLTSDLRVDEVVDPEASYVEADPGGGGFLIKAGTTVSSHYAQWDSGNGSATRVQALIECDSPVVALISADGKLDDSDAILGRLGLVYNDFNLRGLESSADTTNFVDGDIAISWQASTPGDWARFLTVSMSFVLGDMDGNGKLDAFDVDDFELALADKQAYMDTHPGLDPDLLGDMDGSGGLDAFDVSGFESALASAGTVVPEPGTRLALILAGIAVALSRHDRFRSTRRGPVRFNR